MRNLQYTQMNRKSWSGMSQSK